MRSVGVIGAGQMGAGIAQVSAAAGYHVYLSDLDEAPDISMLKAPFVPSERTARMDSESSGSRSGINATAWQERPLSQPTAQSW